MPSPATTLLHQAASITKPSEAVLLRAILDDLRKDADLSFETRTQIIRRICVPAATTLRTPLDWISQAASTDSMRPHLHHVVETVRNDKRELAATDGKRLHVMTFNDIPAADDLPELPDIRRVDTEGTPINAEDATGNYPNYARVIPETTAPVDLDVSDLDWRPDKHSYRLLVGVNDQWFDAAHFLTAANNSRFTYEPGTTPRTPSIIRPHCFPGAFAVLVPTRD